MIRRSGDTNEVDHSEDEATVLTRALIDDFTNTMAHHLSYLSDEDQETPCEVQLVGRFRLSGVDVPLCTSLWDGRRLLFTIPLPSCLSAQSSVRAMIDPYMAYVFCRYVIKADNSNSHNSGIGFRWIFHDGYTISTDMHTVEDISEMLFSIGDEISEIAARYFRG